ncbi:putative small auxin-up RNA [Helianthus annuus]|uniref:Small auxin-up RNA n=1 Tax=Helianthus annuus TaxID=4232 RepID=A0A251RQT9_HELAN|nr:putative small auxin-up RNA [Helianthus annuus]KAJ0429433.1 putative small auxin-up RNA [Helianthus annuus]KAJ0433782.1 putative small auxin-up RNA [Helianthus annuus]KAJ0636570.1 putative small auxin-up RNA [Helianthus annuus]KAJ0667912.1 putative small auxin-up RNA [Helianthus annuus]
MGFMRLSSSLISNMKRYRRLNSIRHRTRNHPRDVPKGHLAVYVGEKQKRRFVIPISFLEQPLFQELLHESEDEFGFDHPMGGLTISCQLDAFFHLIAILRSL